MSSDVCSCGFSDLPDVDHANLALNTVLVKLETARRKALDGEKDYMNHVDVNDTLHKLYHVKKGLIESRHYKVLINKMIEAYKRGTKTSNVQEKLSKSLFEGEKDQNGREKEYTRI